MMMEILSNFCSLGLILLLSSNNEFLVDILDFLSKGDELERYSTFHWLSVKGICVS